MEKAEKEQNIFSNISSNLSGFLESDKIAEGFTFMTDLIAKVNNLIHTVENFEKSIKTLKLLFGLNLLVSVIVLIVLLCN